MYKKIKEGEIKISKLFEIKLTIDELGLLDGKVSEKAQQVIDEAKKESSFGFDDLPIINEIIKKAEKIGKLTWTYKQIRSCDFCDKKYDYHVYPRSGRYHSKGEKNYNKPKYYSGIKFNEGFVTIQGSGDMCSECCSNSKVIERIVDYIITNDLKIEIMRNEFKTSRYLKDNIKVCYSCRKEMQESKMGRESTLMGDGTYPSDCPLCGAKSSAFGRSHEITNKFVLIENPASKPEVEVLREYVKQFNIDKTKSDDQISLGQSRWNNNIFNIKENKWSNGHTTLISIDVKKSIYQVGNFYKGKIESLEDNLKLVGLIAGEISKYI